MPPPHRLWRCINRRGRGTGRGRSKLQVTVQNDLIKEYCRAAPLSARPAPGRFKIDRGMWRKLLYKTLPQMENPMKRSCSYPPAKKPVAERPEQKTGLCPCHCTAVPGRFWPPASRRDFSENSLPDLLLCECRHRFSSPRCARCAPLVNLWERDLLERYGRRDRQIPAASAMRVAV